MHSFKESWAFIYDLVTKHQEPGLSAVQESVLQFGVWFDWLQALVRTHLAALLQQDAVPLSDDVDPFGLPLPDQLRGRTHTPDINTQKQAK